MRLTGYTEQEHREAEDRMLRDMGITGGQGRTPEEIGRDSGSGLLCILGILVILAAVAFVVFSGGCSTVAGVADDLRAMSDGIRAEMAKENQ